MKCDYCETADDVHTLTTQNLHVTLCRACWISGEATQLTLGTVSSPKPEHSQELMGLRTLDYSQFPDSLAPRRFEVCNSFGGVYAHGVAFYRGLVIMAGMFVPFTIYQSIEALPGMEEMSIKWLDPPFPDEEGEA
jgi:hypothetical protein